MKSTLIKDTTKSERIELIKQWEEEEGCENSGMDLMEYFRDYIDIRHSSSYTIHANKYLDLND